MKKKECKIALPSRIIFIKYLSLPCYLPHPKYRVSSRAWHILNAQYMFGGIDERTEGVNVLASKPTYIITVVINQHLISAGIW